MWLIGGLFRRHARALVPWEVEKNLRRLAGEWTEALEKAVGVLRICAAVWLDAELATLDHLLGQQPNAAAKFRAALSRLEDTDGA
jgi:hypothetical protein